MDPPPVPRGCDFPGCTEEGKFRAPKSREALNDYYWFCLSHVQAYNASWDYFSGMDPESVEQELRRAATWDRPSWRMGDGGVSPEHLRERVWAEMAGGGGAGFQAGRGGARSGDDAREQMNGRHRGQAEMAALAVLDLAMDVTWDDVTERYKVLVRRHHPDRNQDDPGAEERLKTINHAYQILKEARAGAAR